MDSGTRLGPRIEGRDLLIVTGALMLLGVGVWELLGFLYSLL